MTAKEVVAVKEAVAVEATAKEAVVEVAVEVADSAVVDIRFFKKQG